MVAPGSTITAHTNPSGLVFFCLQVWVHAGLWGVLRTVYGLRLVRFQLRRLRQLPDSGKKYL